MKCLICNNAFAAERGFNHHLSKIHHLKQQEYYITYYPRYDKFSKELIHFKNKEQYLSTDFNSRDNLKKWIQTTNVNDVKNYCKQVLIDRKEKKQLIYAPSQVELRSILIPPIHIYNQLFGNYYDLCKELGFKLKQTSFSPLPTISKKYSILIDSREQSPLTFNGVLTSVEGLKFGDYACGDENISYNCHIERKSIQDFVGTLSNGYERFQREIEKAKELNGYIVVIVEDLLTNCLHFNENKEVYHKGTRITPAFIFHNVREILQKYNNIQFLFAKNRQHMSELIVKIFNSNGEYRNVDLQFLLDTGKL